MRLIYFILLLTVLVGCSSKKKLSIRTEQNTERFEQKDVQEHKTVSWDSAGQRVTEIGKIREAESEYEITTKTIEYDSSKPVNPTTGRPPVLRETESTIKTKKKNKEDITGKQMERGNVSDLTDKKRSDNSQSYGITEKSEKFDQDNERHSFTLPWFWLIVGGLVVIGVGYCWKKKINPLKWILRI